MDFSIYEVLLDLPELEITDVKIEENAIRFFCKKRGKVSQKCPKCHSLVNRKTPKYVRKV